MHAHPAENGKCANVWNYLKLSGMILPQDFRSIQAKQVQAIPRAMKIVTIAIPMLKPAVEAAIDLQPDFKMQMSTP